MAIGLLIELHDAAYRNLDTALDVADICDGDVKWLRLRCRSGSAWGYRQLTKSCFQSCKIMRLKRAAVLKTWRVLIHLSAEKRAETLCKNN